MSVKVQEKAKALDIWGIAKEVINFDENKPVVEAWINLDLIDGESYVEVSFYETEILTVPDFGEDPITRRFILSGNDILKMYRKIRDVVYLPDNLYALHTHLSAHEALRFDIKIAPVLK